MRIRLLTAAALLGTAAHIAGQENPVEPPKTGSVAGVVIDEKSGDHKGPITIGLTLSEDAKDAAAPSGAAGSTPGKPQTRIAVVGDSDFASNAVVGIQGKGVNLVPPNPPLTTPVTVQLLAKTGSSTQCWQTPYGSALANDNVQFRAKGP